MDPSEPLSKRLPFTHLRLPLLELISDYPRSLVVTNDHLLHELDEAKQRHQHEVQQLHWSYEQLKKTADWMPRSTK